MVSNAQHQRYFYPVEGGAPQPILHLESEDEIIGWSSDRRSLYLARTQEMPIRVYRFDPATGRKELLKEVHTCRPRWYLLAQLDSHDARWKGVCLLDQVACFPTSTWSTD
jgi:hypothetical protein